MKRDRNGTTNAAAQLNVNPRTVRRWADRGWIPSTRTLGGHRRFRAKELAAAVDLSKKTR